jgi:hypothetical protein
VRVAGDNALSVAIVPPDDDGGANITHYNIALLKKTVYANSCKQWKHVLDRTVSGNKNEVEKSPFGIYRITNAATIAASSNTNVYVYDKKWSVHPTDEYTEINYWFTRGTTEKTYPKCSLDAISWTEMWPKSGPRLCPQYSCTLCDGKCCVGKTIHVSAHQGGVGGWIFWHKGKNYPGASCQGGSDQVSLLS